MGTEAYGLTCAKRKQQDRTGVMLFSHRGFPSTETRLPLRCHIVPPPHKSKLQGILRGGEAGDGADI